MIVFQILAGLLCIGGIAYLCLAFRRVLDYHPPLDDTGFHPPVTLMVPARGLAPRLEECLERLCSQDYPGYQIVFGLHSGNDPARPVIERVMAAHPALDGELVIDSRRIGTNPKNCNLANMERAVRHDILVMVDSDVLVKPDFLSNIVRPLAEPGVGGVTCLYTADPEPNLASRLGALSINDWFVPSVLVDVKRQKMKICYGAAIAVTKDALRAVGGFEAMADAVAQDFVIGHELSRRGFAIRLAPQAVVTVVDEPDLSALFRHELRWNRAVRAVRPLDHALSVFMNTLAPAAILLFATWPWQAAAALVGTHVLLRLALHFLLRHRFELPPPRPWWLPVREVMNFLVWLMALSGRRIRWGDRELTTGGGLSMRDRPRKGKRARPW